jgi:hypothetical protein
MADIPKIEAELDDVSKFEAKETSRTVPGGWWLLYFGLIVWGAWYLWSFSPALGGWSQAQDADAGGAPVGSNLLATIAFTALPTAAAVGLWLAQRKRKQA